MAFDQGSAYRPITTDTAQQRADGLTTPAPAPGATSLTATEIPSEEQPVVTGTLFLMMVFLMMIAGFWGIMYYMLLHR